MKIDLNNSKFIEIDKENNIFAVKQKITNFAIVVKLKGILTVNNYSEEDNNQIKNILKNMKEIL